MSIAIYWVNQTVLTAEIVMKSFVIKAQSEFCPFINITFGANGEAEELHVAQEPQVVESWPRESFV